MLSIFLALLVHFLGNSDVSTIAGGGPANRAVVQTPVAPGHHVHKMDNGAGPAG
jgi:hypothetical protein